MRIGQNARHCHRGDGARVVLLRGAVDVLWLRRVKLLSLIALYGMGELPSVFLGGACRFNWASSLHLIVIFIIVTGKRCSSYCTCLVSGLPLLRRRSKDAASTATPKRLLSLTAWLFERIADTRVIIVAEKTGTICLLLNMLLSRRGLCPETTGIKRISNRFGCTGEYKIHIAQRIRK